MGFKFSASSVDFTFGGEEYELPITTRLAIDCENKIGINPVMLFQKVVAAQNKTENMPIGAMSEFFSFMLKRAGVKGVNLDTLYFELMGGENANVFGQTIGNMLAAFIPSGDIEEPDPKEQKSKKATKK